MLTPSIDDGDTYRKIRSHLLPALQVHLERAVVDGEPLRGYDRTLSKHKLDAELLTALFDDVMKTRVKAVHELQAGMDKHDML